jgi:cellulose synthase/poly-beta-1,6-N-acetylglucosamine synthase-like glycosyltransferase
MNSLDISNEIAEPKISFLVPAWNEERMLPRHIASYLSLTYSPKELILCAGGEDATFEIAKQHESEEIVVLRQEAGMGKQGALRKCFEQAAGEICMLTDADTLLEQDNIERLIAPLINGRADAVTGSVRPLAEQITYPLVLNGWAAEVFSNEWSNKQGKSRQICGANTAVWRETLEAVGAFSEEAPIGTDYFLDRKLREKGIRICTAMDSVLETEFPVTWPEYYRQRSRSFRNLLLHGSALQQRKDVLRSLLRPCLSIAFFLPLLLLPWVEGPIWSIPAAIFGLACFWRIRQLVVAAHIALIPTTAKAYLYVPLIVLLYFAVWPDASLRTLIHWRDKAW